MANYIANSNSELRPLFISFESIDGLGKTTQVQKLIEYLENKDIEIYRTKEPGDANFGSNIGSGIRDLLFKHPTTKALAPGVGDLLFLADHIQNSYDVETHIRNGYWVVSDRYADSQFAYTGSGTKRCPDWAMELYREQYGYGPDIIVFLSAVPDETGEYEWALERARKRTGVEAGKQDGKAWNDYEEQKRIQLTYTEQLATNTRAIAVPVKKDDTIEDVHQNILLFIRQKLASHPMDINHGSIF